MNSEGSRGLTSFPCIPSSQVTSMFSSSHFPLVSQPAQATESQGATSRAIQLGPPLIRPFAHSLERSVNLDFFTKFSISSVSAQSAPTHFL